MTYNKELCRQIINNFVPYELETLSNMCNNNSSSALVTLNEIYQKNPNYMYSLASEAYKHFVSCGVCRPEQWEGRYNLIATYGYCLNSLFFAYSLTDGSMCLYTSSLDVVLSLVKSNKLKSKGDLKTDLDKFMNYFSASKLKKSVGDGLLRAIRLDAQTVGNEVYLIGTCPRSALDLKQYIIIPFQSVASGMKLLSDKLQESIIEVVQGDKVRYVTRNKGVLEQVYGKERADELLLSSCIDVYSNRFYVPSLGASKYSYGLTNLKLADIDSIRVLNSIEGIDLSEINVDYSMVKDYFVDTVSRMSDNGIRTLEKYFDTGLSNISVNVLRNIMRNTDKYPRTLYDIMKENPSLFNMDKFRTIKSKFGDMCEKVDIPRDIDSLRELLRTGIFRMTRTTKKGSMSTVVCTLSTKELIKVYGFEKWVRLEPLKLRMEMMYKKVSDFDCKEVTLDMFKMLDKIFHPNFFIEQTVSKQDFLHLINHYMMSVDDSNRVPSYNNALTVRSCEATYDTEEEKAYGYFYSVDPKTIMSLTRLSK